MASGLVDLDLQEHHRTDNAVLVSLDGDPKRAVWLPFSQIEIEGVGTLRVTVPEWLAIQKGLV